MLPVTPCDYLIEEILRWPIGARFLLGTPGLGLRIVPPPPFLFSGGATAGVGLGPESILSILLKAVLKLALHSGYKMGLSVLLK